MTDKNVYLPIDVRLVRQTIRRHAPVFEDGKSAGFDIEHVDDDYVTVVWKNVGNAGADHRESAERLAGILEKNGFAVAFEKPSDTTLIIRRPAEFAVYGAPRSIRKISDSHSQETLMQGRVLVTGEINARRVVEGALQNTVVIPKGDYDVTLADKIGERMMLRSVTEPTQQFCMESSRLRSANSLGHLRFIQQPSTTATPKVNGLDETVDGLLTGDLSINEAVSLQEKERKSKPSYWRTMDNGHKVGFKGKPPRGRMVAGNPHVRKAMAKHNKSWKQTLRRAVKKHNARDAARAGKK